MRIPNFRDMSSHWMSSNKMFAGLNCPAKLTAKYNKDGEEIEQGLPPYERVNAYLVDKYPACPANWMRSEGKATSYFVPVKENHGMWLDFNHFETEYHVACVVSVQGINAVTGLPVTDVFLEQYIEKCPKHDIKFGPERFCKKCNYKWPKQNYIATTGTPDGQFWIDGFRAADGVVRQYIMTQDKMKGVANAIIGENRVFAVGISFFLSKDGKRFKPVYINTINSLSVSDYVDFGNVPDYYVSDTLYDAYTQEYNPNLTNNDINKVYVTSSTKGISNFVNFSAEIENKTSILLESSGTKTKSFLRTAVPQEVNVQKLEVGAGARIKQVIYDDPESLDYWRTEPEGIIYINYCLEEDAIKIINAGKNDITGSGEGFLQDVTLSV